MTTAEGAAVKVTVTFQPVGRSFKVARGDVLFNVAAECGVEVDTVCGGNGSCGKCKVQFQDFTPAPTPLDYVHLTAGEIARGVRLACQVAADRDMVVQVPAAGARSGVRILHHGVTRDIELRPNIRKVFVPYENPRLREHVSDWDRLRLVLPRKLRPVDISLRVLRKLPGLVRNPAGLTMVLTGRRVIELEPGNTAGEQYGVAFDVGSTTIVGFLMDLATGAEAAVASAVNRQSAYGDDIIGRLSRSQRNPEGLGKLHEMVIEQLNGLIADLASRAGIPADRIYEVTVVGNMAMHHFLLQLDSTYLGLAPYAPVIREEYVVNAADIGLSIRPEAPVFVLPNIAGFVGSDTVGVMLASDLGAGAEYRMAIDVGTNGEMALANRERLIACSAPAGPALEGARIRMGMRAAPGAIDHVRIGSDVEITVIGGLPPVGICGSALIDIVAQLRKAGLMNRSGAFLRKSELPPDTPPRLRERLIEAGQRKHTYFILARAQDAGGETDVVITQQDIRECQLAKGAIRAGAMLLLQEMGITENDLAEVQLAGAFGNFLDPESALRAGLTPNVPLDRIRSVGNAAGVGAKLALLSVQERKRAIRIAQRTEHIQLSGSAAFQKAFTVAMQFPT
ncbi:MAG: DUF4445 domain-containing protein [Betaproteobacteria bacterium]|nr:DUF4445 domain-containing protein [Betaproteobacteria bacterium]